MLGASFATITTHLPTLPVIARPPFSLHIPMNGPSGEQPKLVAEQQLRQGSVYSFQQRQVQRRQQNDNIAIFARHIHCFRIQQPLRDTTSSSGKPKRARLTDQAKEKVLGVRRQGACLRCRMLKIECSLENPCQACLSSALKGTERKVLSWSYCIRTRFADVDIFQVQSPPRGPRKMRTETLMLKMGALLGRIAQPAQFVNLGESSFNQKITKWLLDEAYTMPELQGGSMVAGMCANLLGLSFTSEDDTKKEQELEELTHDFRRFLMAASMEYSKFESRLVGVVSREEAWTAGRMSGSRMLLALDRILTPQYLGKLSRESCQVLFLVVLGAVLGIGYSSRSVGREMQQQSRRNEEAENWELQQSPTLWLAMRDHLCQMLAHHLIFLGSLLGIKLDTGMERRVIEWAAKGWGRISPSFLGETGGMQTNGCYVWGHGIVTPPNEEMQALDDGGEKMPDANPVYWDDSTPRTERPFEPPPPLVAVPFDPEISQFQNERMYDWDQNPTSYLDMDMPSAEPESYDQSQPAKTMANKMGFPLRANTEPCFKTPGFEPPRGIKKRRTMWVVRTVDTGPEYGRINVHARLRGHHGRSGRADLASLETLTGFV